MLRKFRKLVKRAAASTLGLIAPEGNLARGRQQIATSTLKKAKGKLFSKNQKEVYPDANSAELVESEKLKIGEKGKVEGKGENNRSEKKEREGIFIFFCFFSIN